MHKACLQVTPSRLSKKTHIVTVRDRENPTVYEPESCDERHETLSLQITKTSDQKISSLSLLYLPFFKLIQQYGRFARRQVETFM